MSEQQVLIRPIRPADNAAVARIIRDVMTEFGAVGCNFSIADPEVDRCARPTRPQRLLSTWSSPAAAGWVAAAWAR